MSSDLPTCQSQGCDSQTFEQPVQATQHGYIEQHRNGSFGFASDHLPNLHPADGWNDHVRCHSCGTEYEITDEGLVPVDDETDN